MSPVALRGYEKKVQFSRTRSSSCLCVGKGGGEILVLASINGIQVPQGRFHNSIHNTI